MESKQKQKWPNENEAYNNRVTLGIFKKWDLVDPQRNIDRISGWQTATLNGGNWEKNGTDQKSDNKIGRITRRVKFLTTLFLFSAVVVALGVLINRGEICISK